MTTIQKIKEQCSRLRLYHVPRLVERHCIEAREKELTHSEFLCSVLESEISSREQKDLQKRLRAANLPPKHDLDEFDFNQSHSLSESRMRLQRVEWLYRWRRIDKPHTENFQDFERRMLSGTKEEREGLKTKIFHLERKAPQFQYFRPVDDWQPEPPKEEDVEKSDTDTRSTQKAETQSQQSASKPLPHERKSNLTPGEIQAIKDMRANPHIPEDAKPSLPEGYE